ncbi:MAG: hypothetical protein HZB91_06480 [Elusimicrobia bacterium]|nr:hypothetical protein [Elusimicrobiota bacterium]
MWALIGLLAAAGPLLRGAVDLWAQTLLLAAVTAGTALWLSARIAGGQVPAPQWGVLAWAGALAFLGWLAAGAGPLAAYGLAEWRWRLGGLWVFVTLAAVSEDGRDRVDAAIHAAAWALVLLIFWQGFMEGRGRPSDGVLKEYVFSGAGLFFLPLAARRRDYLLLSALLAGMLWNGSGAAWLALALALLALRPRQKTSRVLSGALAAVCAAAFVVKLGDPAVQAQRPWTGWGPGAFAQLLTLLFFGGSGFFLLAGRTHRTFGAMAVFIQSLWCPTLSIPANFWLFSYCAGSSIKPVSRLIEVPPRWRLPAIILVLGSGALLSTGLWDAWQADRLRAMAAADALRRGAGFCPSLGASR